MSAWPTLREWFQFGGTLALELLIVFAVAKLLALRLRSAQGRRALWQITVLAMLLVTAGELAGVRGWLRLPEKKTSPPAATTKVVVTFKNVEPELELFGDNLAAATPPATMQPQPAPHLSRWQQHAVWPALLWATCAALVLFRLLIAQGLALGLRLAARRSCGQPCPPDTGAAGEIADMAVRNSVCAPQTGDPALIQRLGLLAQAQGIRRSVTLLTSVRAVVPFTFGVWHPVIVLPRSFATAFTPEQQDAVVAHELAHVAGFDSAWRFVSQLTCALLWWHPLAWLAKRELDHASELVADEASLLVANGPDRLAECLLACAKGLRRPTLAGRLGMDGGGFRSALGKRVARLLQLNPHARLSRSVPWYLRLIAPIVCAALLWMGMAAVVKSGEPRGGAWRSSILGSAFAAAAESVAAKPVAPERAALLQELYAQGVTYDDSRRDKSLVPTAAGKPGQSTETNRVELALKTNGAALRFTSAKRQAVYDKLRGLRLREWGPLDSRPLGEVIRVLSAETRRIDPDLQGVNFILSGNAVPNPGGVDASGLPIAPTNEPVDLNAVVIRLGTAIKNPTLEEALNILEKITDRKIKYSVEDFGVLISPRSDEPTPLHARFFQMDSNAFQRVLQSIPPALTNASSTAPAPPQTVIPVLQNWFKSVGVELTQPGKAVFFGDRLGVLMVRATLEDLDVIEKTLQPMGVGRATNAALQVKPVTWTNALPSAPLINVSESPSPGGPVAVEQKWTDPVNRNPDRTGQAQTTNTTELQTRFFRVDPNTLFQGLDSVMGGSFPAAGRRSSGGRTTNATGGFRFESAVPPTNFVPVLKSFLHTAGADLSAPGRSLFYNERVETIMVRATSPELDVVEKALQLLNMSPPQLEIFVKVMEVPADQASKTMLEFGFTTNPAAQTGTLGSTNRPAPALTGILTDAQFRAAIRALEKGGATDLMSAPSVTTMSGRQAQIKVVDIRYIVTDLDIGATNPKNKKPEIAPIAEPFELGPVIDVVPYVQPDGYTIQLTVVPSLKEFLGYEDPQTVQPAIAGAAQANGVTSPMPLPKFRLRQVATSAMVWDGQTLVIGAGNARNMERVRHANRTITTNYTETALFFFITPRLIDPAGNPLHSAEDFPDRSKRVPFQKGRQEP